jgi:predicted DCC family thiol-disulfide oxidoreductase YuxK
MTETTDTFPARNRFWVLYDALCPLCLSSVERWRGTFERRGAGFIPLQDPRAEAYLGLRPGEVPAEMQLVLPDGRRIGGHRAIAWLCRRVWWLAALGVVMEWPVADGVARAAYRWIARNRYCMGDVCRVPLQGGVRLRHHAATTFLETP